MIYKLASPLIHLLRHHAGRQLCTGNAAKIIMTSTTEDIHYIKFLVADLKSAVNGPDDLDHSHRARALQRVKELTGALETPQNAIAQQRHMVTTSGETFPDCPLARSVPKVQEINVFPGLRYHHSFCERHSSREH